MDIIVKNALVKTYHSIGMVVRYYRSLWQVYLIITTKIPGIKPNLALQMSFKAINNLMGFNGLDATLLIFGTYPRITKLDALSLLIPQRAMAIKKAMDELRKYIAFW